MSFTGTVTGWFKNPFAKYESNFESIIYLLVFLFPIAGMSVNHWISSIFNVLVLIGLFTLKRNNRGEPLHKDEKIFLWVCAAYFFMFIVSSLANGWTDVQTRYLGTELRFILIIPLYLLIRRYKDSTQWLLKGCVVAGFVLLGQSYYDISVLGRATAWGVYSKNIIGPFAVLAAFCSLFYFMQNRKKLAWPFLVIILASVICAMIAAGMSGSRGAYVGFVVTALGCVMFFSKPRWMLVSLAIISMIVVLFYYSSEIVNKGVNVAINQYQDYLNANDHVTDVSSNSSVGVRLEMMRTGFLFVKDNPFVGIGPGNYKETAESYIKEGKASPAIAQYHHPHNTFIEVASSKGVLGLATLLLLLYYPFYVFVRDYKVCKSTSVLGLIHIVAISVFSLTDHSVVLMNNYTSILLLGLAIFFSEHINRCKLAHH